MKNATLNSSIPAATPFCSICFHSELHRSRHRAWDRLIALFGYSPHRCRVCRKRFYLRRGRNLPAKAA